MEILFSIIIVCVIGIIAGTGLSLAAKFMNVPTDEKQELIRKALPGANCGACGYLGCDDYAVAVAKGESEPDKCTVGGSTTANVLSEILGIEIICEPKVAFITCNASAKTTKLKYNYLGMQSCSAAATLYNGPLECEFGCIGYGDCAKECPFDAIVFNDSKPSVCEDICVGCGKCAEVCPKSIISIIPKNHGVVVACANKNKGVSVVKSCGVSCIACGLCEKACEKNAIKVLENLAVIDYSICDNCGKCKEVCKRGVLI